MNFTTHMLISMQGRALAVLLAFTFFFLALACTHSLDYSECGGTRNLERQSTADSSGCMSPRFGVVHMFSLSLTSSDTLSPTGSSNQTVHLGTLFGGRSWS